MDQQTVNEILDGYKQEFIDALSTYTLTYKVMGMSSDESPMWLQYRGVRDFNFTFVNSQRSGLRFEIPLKEEDYDLLTYSRTEWVYDYFRKVKYDHLKTVYPQIYSEIKPL